MVSKIDENVGGVASYTRTLAKALRKKNVDVKIIKLKQIFKLEGDIIHIQHEPLLFSLLTSILFPLIVLVIKLVKKKPIVITLHGVMKLEDIREFAFENKIYFPSILIKYTLFLIFKYIITISNIVIVHAPSFKKWLVNQYYSKEKKIKIIPHGVWKGKVIPKKRAKELLGFSNQRIFFTLGYLAKHKGLEGLIRAFEQLKLENTKLIIGGTIPPRFKDDLEYQRYISYLKKISNKDTIYPGYIAYEDLPLYFNSTDFFIVPHKRRVSASGPLCRALGYKIPIIALNNEVLRSYISKESLFADMNEALYTIKEGEINPKKMKRGAKSIATKYSWNNVAKLTLNLYKSVKG